MKVLHIGTYLDDGAGLGMVRLHADLLSQGVDSRVLVMSTDAPDPRIAGFIPTGKHPKSRIRDIPEKVLHRLGFYDAEFYRAGRFLSQRHPAFRSSPFTRIDICSHRWINDADIIHLHWVARFLDWRTFFPKIQKPIVWTMRDENPALGFWHFRSDMPVPMPDSARREDDWLRHKKERIVAKCRSLSIVSLSSAEDDFFAHSDAFAGRPHAVIPNSIDASVFRSYSDTTVREEFGIGQQDVVLAFVAQDISERRKGLEDLLDAVVRMGRKDICILCVGQGKPPPIPGEVRFFPIGRVEDPTRLARIFSAADLFVTPSHAETFGKTTTEALACGVPVVSYPNSGAIDIVGPHDGILTKDFTPEALQVTLQEALSRTFDPVAIRSRVVSRFSRERIVQSYLKIYKAISPSLGACP